MVLSYALHRQQFGNGLCNNILTANSPYQLPGSGKMAGKLSISGWEAGCGAEVIVRIQVQGHSWHELVDSKTSSVFEPARVLSTRPTA